ncbi:MAG: hypothetical protein H0X59_08590 [Chloroflexi bacterium]|nr:hypothetical protein [Chloroflexota bacterium]
MHNADPPTHDATRTTVHDLRARLDAVEARLGSVASADPPPGLTDPDPSDGERWQAGQVWSHVAEFVPYWMGEAEKVIGAASPEPVPFGRIKTDTARIEAIERGRHGSAVDVISRVSASIEAVRIFTAELDGREWEARGAHQTGGVMNIRDIFERFVAGHLEEHAEQLEKLAGV